VPRIVANFLFSFACLFGGLSLPLPGLAPGASRLAAWLGNAAVADAAYASGTRMHFESCAAKGASSAQAPEAEGGEVPSRWQTVLMVERSYPARAARVPIDLRALGYLPLAAFVALTLASPVAPKRRLRMLLVGLSVLVPIVIAFIALPLAAFVGGEGPIQVFSLGPALRVPMNIVYRGFVSPPGMAYALPAVVWWSLLRLTRPNSGSAPISPAASAYVPSAPRAS
jgi:hypothetical protein